MQIYVSVSRDSDLGGLEWGLRIWGEVIVVLTYLCNSKLSL